MADHVRKQIKDAVATALTGLPMTTTNVFTDRPEILNQAETPGLLINTGDEEVLIDESIGNTERRQVLLTITGVLKVKHDQVYLLDRIAKEIEEAMAIDPRFSGAAANSTYVGCAQEVSGDDTDLLLAEITLNYLFRYSVARGVPDVATH